MNWREGVECFVRGAVLFILFRQSKLSMMLAKNGDVTVDARAAEHAFVVNAQERGEQFVRQMM